MSEPETPPQEFNRLLPMVAVGPEGRERLLEATPEECAALAARFDILGVDWLRAELQLRQEGGGAIRVRGTLRAQVRQACVVTLEPVVQTVEDPVDLRFLPRGATFSEDPEGPDEIECEDDVMPLGEAMAEQLSLALDPYPRAPGAALPEELQEEEEPEAPPNPFAALSKLRQPR